MSREIKFRGWDSESKRMLCPQDLSMPRAFWEWIGCFDLPIMQYTGLKDKNGVEIYEGDILQNTNPQWHSRIIFVMEWESDIGAWNRYGPREDFEVAGNIHQNPELLERTE